MNHGALLPRRPCGAHSKGSNMSFLRSESVCSYERIRKDIRQCKHSASKIPQDSRSQLDNPQSPGKCVSMCVKPTLHNKACIVRHTVTNLLALPRLARSSGVQRSAFCSFRIWYPQCSSSRQHIQPLPFSAARCISVLPWASRLKTSDLCYNHINYFTSNPHFNVCNNQIFTREQLVYDPGHSAKIQAGYLISCQSSSVSC